MDYEKLHFMINVTFFDDTYSYGEYKDMECSVFFEFEEVLKQIDFKDKKLYVALDVSPGYSPSGKGRNYGNLESMILDLL